MSDFQLRTKMHQRVYAIYQYKSKIILDTPPHTSPCGVWIWLWIPAILRSSVSRSSVIFNGPNVQGAKRPDWRAKRPVGNTSKRRNVRNSLPPVVEALPPLSGLMPSCCCRCWSEMLSPVSNPSDAYLTTRDLPDWLLFVSPFYFSLSSFLSFWTNR